MYLVRSDSCLPSPPDEALVCALRADVERFSFPRHFAWESSANRRATEMLAESFDQMGFHVVIDGPWRNVIALPADRDPVLTLVGAHYDSVPRSPGADDNASALAAMLYAARRVGPHAGCVFVGFNREEDGLLGSTDLVTHGLERLELEIKMAHILEMLGYTAETQRIPPGLPIRAPKDGHFLGLLGKDRSNPELRRITALGSASALEVLGLQTWFGVDTLLPDLHRSDHSPFWLAGIPALMWTDTSEFRNPHYHSPTDTPDTLDYVFLSRVSALLDSVLSPPSLQI